MEEIVTLCRDFFQEYFARTFLRSSLSHGPIVQDHHSLFTHLSGRSNLHNDDASSAAVGDEVSDVADVWNFLLLNCLSSSSNLKTNKTQTTVVVGDSSSGKSTLALSLVHELWVNYCSESTIPQTQASSNPKLIPIYINASFLQGEVVGLKHLLFPSIQSYKDKMEELGLNEEGVFKELRSDKFKLVLFLDGYEQLRSFKDFSWLSDFAHIVVFTRPEAFSNRRELDKVFPCSKEIALNPFSHAQIDAFIKNVIKLLNGINVEEELKNGSSDPWLLTKECTSSHPYWERHDATLYTEWMNVILPELGELGQNPLILTFLVQILPLVVEDELKKVKDKQDNIDLVKTEVRRVLNTEVGIYDQFTSIWFQFQSKQILQMYPSLQPISSHLTSYLEAYAQNLAAKLVSLGRGAFKDGVVKVTTTMEWDLWVPNMNTEMYKTSQEDPIHSSLFPQSEEDMRTDNPRRAHLLALRSGCLLRCLLGEKDRLFQFLHLRLIEFFASREVFKGLGGELKYILQNMGVKPSLYSFNRASIRSRKYMGVLDNLANWAKVDPHFRSVLHSVVQESRNVAAIGLMSSNAFTVLARVQHVWSHEDFSYCNLSTADMSHCMFYNCDFRGVNMSRALITGSRFSKCKFQGANMWDCEFGVESSVILQPGVSLAKKNDITCFQTQSLNLKDTVLYTYENSLRELYPEKGREVIHFQMDPSTWNFKIQYFQILPDSNNKALLLCREKGEECPALFLVDISRKGKWERLDIQSLVKMEDPEEFVLEFDGVKTTLLNDTCDRESEFTLNIFSAPIKGTQSNIVCYQSTPGHKYKGEAGVSFTDPGLFFCYQWDGRSSFTTTDKAFNFTLRSNRPIQGFSFAFDPNHALLATTCDADLYLVVFDLTSSDVLLRRSLPASLESSNDNKFAFITCMSFSRDGRYLLYGVDDAMNVWNAEKGNPVKIDFPGNRRKGSIVESLAFSSSDMDLAALTFGGPRVFVLNMEYCVIVQMIADVGLSPGFIGFKDRYHVTCMSHYGDMYVRRIAAPVSEESLGVPKSTQVMKALPNFHNLVNKEHHIANAVLSPGGRFVAVYGHDRGIRRKHGDETPMQMFLFLFKICENTGERSLAFSYTFSAKSLHSPDFDNIRVKFWHDEYLILTHFESMKIFCCQDGALPSIADLPSQFDKMWFDQGGLKAIFKCGSTFQLHLLAEEAPGSLVFMFEYQIVIIFEVEEVFFFTKNQGDVSYAYIFSKEESNVFYLWDLYDSNNPLLPITMSESVRGMGISGIHTLATTADHFPILFFISGSGMYFQASIRMNGLELKCQLESVPYPYSTAFTFVKLIPRTDLFVKIVGQKTLMVGTVRNGIIKYKFAFQTHHSFHDVVGFLKDSNLRILLSDHECITCLEISVDELTKWEGDYQDFDKGWKVLWADKTGEQFSLFHSTFTNTIVSRASDWNFLSKRYSTNGDITFSEYTYTSRPSLFKEVSAGPESLFSQERNHILSEENWKIFVFAKIRKSGFFWHPALDVHAGIIIEGILSNRHFAIRAELGRYGGGGEVGIKMTSLSSAIKLEKFERDFIKKYKAKEYPISGDNGKAIIEDILRMKQSPVKYSLFAKGEEEAVNCNRWVKRVLRSYGIHVEDAKFVDLPGDFFSRVEKRGFGTSMLSAAMGRIRLS